LAAACDEQLSGPPTRTTTVRTVNPHARQNRENPDKRLKLTFGFYAGHAGCALVKVARSHLAYQAYLGVPGYRSVSRHSS